MNEIYIPINPTDILTGRTTTRVGNVSSSDTVESFYTCSVQVANSSSNYYISEYLESSPTITDQQLLDIGFGQYVETYSSQYNSSSCTNYRYYAQQCLISQNSKFSLNGTTDTDKIIFINYNNTLLKNRINISNYELNLKHGSQEVLLTVSNVQNNVTGINPMCGRVRYLLSGSTNYGWLLYDKKLAIIDASLVSASLGFN